jgi:uncharacterized protein YhaN
LKNDGVSFSPDYINQLKLKSNDIIEQINLLENNSGNLKEKINNLFLVDKRDDLFADLKALKKEREELMIKRSIISVAKDLIISFDKEFKDENQPDILKNTSHYFSIVTDNKYEKVYMKSDTNELMLKSEFGEKSIEEGFSRGTKEQLYFCFRLAIIKHMHDKKSYNLPIILDDIFVNWDLKRLSNLKNLMLEISKERQVIMFTCHKSQLDLFGSSDLVNTFKL